jgi:hypothetical protein
LKGQKEHVGNVSHGPKKHGSFVTRKSNMWYIYHIRWGDMQGQEFHVGKVSHGPKKQEEWKANITECDKLCRECITWIKVQRWGRWRSRSGNNNEKNIQTKNMDESKDKDIETKIASRSTISK